jgi:hypothetical protein
MRIALLLMAFVVIGYWPLGDCSWLFKKINLNGSEWGQKIYRKTENIKSLIECTSLCSADEECGFQYFDKSNQICYLGNMMITKGLNSKLLSDLRGAHFELGNILIFKTIITKIRRLLTRLKGLPVTSREHFRKTRTNFKVERLGENLRCWGKT